jgi:hypothetical protein
MITRNISLLFSAILALRSIGTVLITYLLYLSNNINSSETMYVLQISAVYGSLVYLIFFNGLSVEYCRKKYSWIENLFKNCIVVFSLIGVISTLYFESLIFPLILMIVVLSLVFINSKLYLKWHGILLQTLLSVMIIIILGIKNVSVYYIINIWIIFNFISSLFLIKKLSFNNDKKNIKNKLKKIFESSYKILFSSIVFMAVMLIERELAVKILVNDNDRKEFFLFLTIINSISVLGSGFLNILGPKLAVDKSDLQTTFKKYKSIISSFIKLQLLFGLIILFILYLVMNFKLDMTILIFKIILMISLFYYQIVNQSHQFLYEFKILIVNSFCFFVGAFISAALSYKMGDFSVFYIILSLFVIFIFITNYINFKEKKYE